MQKLFYIIFLTSILIAGLSCSKNNDDLSNENSQIIIDLKSDISFKGEENSKAIATRAIDESAYKNILNYEVSLFKTATGENIHSAPYGSWSLAYEVEPNVEYRLDAAYGNPEFKASYDELYVYGSSTFTLDEKTTKTITFSCKPQAVKVKLFISEDFEQYFQECSVAIQTKHLDAPFTMTLADKDKELYLFENTEDNIELTFLLTDKNGKEASQTKTVQVTPQTFLKIKMSPDVTEIEGGKFGLDITVSTDITDENIDIIIPNDVFNN